MHANIAIPPRLTHSLSRPRRSTPAAGRARALRRVGPCVALIVAWAVLASPAEAQETFQVLSVDTTGCNSGNFGMTVQRANLDGGTYTVRTVVTVAGDIYMNEAATISVNGNSGWSVFDNFSYGPVPNQGTYPIPSGETMTLDFTLERPQGTILYAWRLIVDGCDTGNILFNDEVAIPTLPIWALLLLILSLSVLGVRRLRPRSAA
jgi:hypothetical protein